MSTTATALEGPLSISVAADSNRAQQALDRVTVEALLDSEAFNRRADRSAQRLGLGLVLDWLDSYPGASWQDRWLLSGVEAGMQSWRSIPLTWMSVSGIRESRQDDFFHALRLLIGADVLRPSLRWLIAARFGRGSLARVMAHHRDPDGFARLQAIAEATPDMSRAALNRSIYRVGILLATTGGLISDLTPDHVLEILDAETEIQGKTVGATNLFYRLLRETGEFGPDAPMTYRQLRTRGQRTPEQIIDRYQLRSQPIRNLFVDYLRERQPSLDYTSLESLANHLAGLFWSDIEQHHPEVTALDLPAPVADAWKTRLRSVTKIIRNADGSHRTISTPRINYRECLTPVRAFYLDLSHWAVEDPARWAHWLAPCPVGADEVDRRKDKRHRKARMDSRTRQRLPVLPVLVKTVNQRRITAAAALHTAQSTQPGETFTIGDQTLRRVAPRRSGLTEPTGEPLRFTPHDFRRLFITDAILNGLPPHIAQVIAGHSDINTTIGYNTIYPDETIRAHRAFLARRRALRPSEEYRTPSEQEWEEFLGHFERRKVSLGTCARSFGTPCIHEHACVRCPMLWPDPAQRGRLTEIIDNLTDRITEAEEEGWHGEIEGLQVSKSGAVDKLSQLDRRSGPVQLGMPTVAERPTAGE